MSQTLLSPFTIDTRQFADICDRILMVFKGTFQPKVCPFLLYIFFYVHILFTFAYWYRPSVGNLGEYSPRGELG